MITLNDHLIHFSISVEETLSILNKKSHELVLFVVDDNGLLAGSVTDGDIRRGLLKGINLKDEVSRLMNTNVRAIKQSKVDIHEVKRLRNLKIFIVPIIDDSGIVRRLINLEQKKSILPIDVVIMAGGIGKRLRPFTNNTPKPLLEINNKPIIEYSFDLLSKYAIENVNVTLRYLGYQIEERYKNGYKDLNVKFCSEEEELGTLGAVSLIQNIEHDTVLVMNSDLLTNIDLEDFYLEFKEKDADISIASVPYMVNIPYAIFDLVNGEIKSLKEKPTYTYYSNAGMYLIKSSLLKNIPYNKFLNAPDFVSSSIETGKKVITYPVINYWLDIGKPEDFEKAKADIKHLNFNY